MVRSSGNHIILSPPLTIKQEELDVIVDALEYGLSRVQD
jgi:adenosylmethionine-8-amino-7-oxononanoate aminotransferase